MQRKTAIILTLTEAILDGNGRGVEVIPLAHPLAIKLLEGGEARNTAWSFLSPSKEYDFHQAIYLKDERGFEGERVTEVRYYLITPR